MRSLFALGMLAVSASLYARGFPIVETYTAKQHQGGTQVFAATQDRAGVLHFGTLRGVMSYDGASWRMTALPNDSAVFAVATRSGPEIAVGAVDEFGWMAPDEAGAMKYHSLSAQLPSLRELGDVRGICATANAFFFVAERAVIAWSGGAPRVIASLPDSTIPRSCRDHYITGSDGLRRIDATTMTVTPAGFDGKTTDAIVGDVVSVRGEGLFHVGGAPFANEASQWLKTKTVTAASRLRDGRLVIGTRQDGVLLLTPSGEIEQRLDTAAGLPMAVLAHAFEDREGALWLSYHGPVVRIDLALPVSVIDARSGLRGAVNSFARDGERLWIATSHGLFVSDGTSSAVRAIEGVPVAAWCVLSLDGEMLVGTSEGAFLVGADGRARIIAGTKELVVYEALRSTSDPSRVWLSLRKGMATLRRGANGWQFEGLLANGPSNSRTLVEHDGALWVGTTFDGVQRFDGKTFHQVGEKTEAHVSMIGGRIAVYESGALFFVGPHHELVRDEALSKLAGDAYLIAEDPRGNLWFNTTPPRLLPRLPNGQYAREALPLVPVDPANISVLQANADGVVWFGSEEGLYRFTSTASQAAAAQPAPLITRVARGNGARVTAPLPHSFGRLRIEFAPLSYRRGVVYQYRLDPSDNAWSGWSAEAFVDYTSLDPGDYTFRVRARSASGQVSPESRWTFTVLPPWYRSQRAMMLWFAIAAVLAAIIIALIVRMRTTALRRQARRLQQLVDERTDELRQANAQLERLSLLDELTGIANRRYFQRALTEDWRHAIAEQKPLALVLLDLDHFKKLNDERGHLEGDQALMQVARYLSRQIRRSSGELPSRIADIVARIGGEEFAVLLSNTNAEDARYTAERLRAGVESLGVGVTISCGVASMQPNIPDAWNTLIDRADRALYAAKAAGRNCVRADDEILQGNGTRGPLGPGPAAAGAVS
jgi:diguanylate cyclase (GGDEF)-like protein